MGVLKKKYSDIKFCTSNFPPLHFEVINFMWMSKEQIDFIVELIIKKEKERKKIYLSLQESPFLSLLT